MQYLRIGAALAIALVYLLYDLFNRRNIPNIAVYATLCIGIAFTIALFNVVEIAESALIASAVFALGFLAYRYGQLGLGDVAEFAALSLIMPFQGMPLLYKANQYALPFVFSLFIASGIAAIILVPIAYMPRISKKRLGGKASSKLKAKAILIGASYLAFIGVLSYYGIMTVYGIAIMGLLLIGSVFIITFEGEMAKAMISYKEPHQLEEEDMVAISIIEPALLKKVKSACPEFTGLVTKSAKEKLLALNGIKLPVYDNGIPFAVPIFIGLVASLLFGNLMLLVI